MGFVESSVLAWQDAVNVSIQPPSLKKRGARGDFLNKSPSIPLFQGYVRVGS